LDDIEDRQESASKRVVSSPEQPNWSKRAPTRNGVKTITLKVNLLYKTFRSYTAEAKAKSQPPYTFHRKGNSLYTGTNGHEDVGLPNYCTLEKTYTKEREVRW